MKLIFSLFIIMSLTKECNKSTDSISSDSTDTAKKISEKNQIHDNVTLEYKAISRGTYNHIIITAETILVQEGSDSMAISKKCSKTEWSKLKNTLTPIELKNISKLKAPTEARFYDGAATAQLIIKQNSTTFESSSFDHGSPPKEIKALVNEILSLSENIE
jgi:heat shock protein HslJ